MSRFLPPINLQAWIHEHQHLLKPPVCNQQVYEVGDFMIMVIGGPNQRKDFHNDPGDEFFYQIKGDIVLRIMDQGKPKDIPIKEGDMFLLPANIHHSPQRSEGSIGMVIERKRQPGELDSFHWYCERCYSPIHAEYLELKDIVEDLPPIFKRYADHQHEYKCKLC